MTKTMAMHVRYLSNRPQFSMGYKLINHAGCWWNTRRICTPQAAGERFMNSSSVLPTFQVVYQPLYNNQINARALIGQSAVGYCAGKPT